MAKRGPGGRPPISERTRGLRREFGERLRRVREHAGLEPEEVARYVDIRPDHLRQMETGDRPIPAEWVPELARTLGVTAAHLMGEQKAVLESAA